MLDYLLILLSLAALLLLVVLVGRNLHSLRQEKTLAGPKAGRLAERDAGGANGAGPGGPARGARDLERMQPGGVFAVRHAGADMVDLDDKVLARHGYDEGGYRWFELEGETQFGPVWLTVISDDELELMLTRRKLSLADLGLTPEELALIARRGQGRLTFEGTAFRFNESGSATFLRNEDPERVEPFRYWDFVAEDKAQAVTIEAWGRTDQRFAAHLSDMLSPAQVTIYALEGTE